MNMVAILSTFNLLHTSSKGELATNPLGSIRRAYAQRRAIFGKPTYEAEVDEPVMMKSSNMRRQCVCSTKHSCDRGPPGPSGKKGEDGLPGEAGKEGLKGMDSVDISAQRIFMGCSMCPPGPKGVQGPDGQLGTPGSKGPRGIQGSPGRNGTTGLPGDIGLPGKPGRNGRPGPVGHCGLNGTLSYSMPGLKGKRGQQGRTGERGEDGLDNNEIGEIGPDGPRGEPGYLGPTGQEGERGPIGPSGLKGASQCQCKLLLGRNDSHYTEPSHKRQSLQELSSKHQSSHPDGVLHGLAHISVDIREPIVLSEREEITSQASSEENSVFRGTKAGNIFNQRRRYIDEMSGQVSEQSTPTISPDKVRKKEESVEEKEIKKEGKEEKEEYYSDSEEETESDNDPSVNTTPATQNIRETVLLTTESSSLSTTQATITDKTTIAAAKSTSSVTMTEKTETTLKETSSRSESHTAEKDDFYETVVLIPRKSSEIIRKQKLLSFLNNSGRLWTNPTPPPSPPRVRLYSGEAKEAEKSVSNREISIAKVEDLRTNGKPWAVQGKPEILRSSKSSYPTNAFTTMEVHSAAPEQTHQRLLFERRKNAYRDHNGKTRRKLIYDMRLEEIPQNALGSEPRGAHKPRFAHSIVPNVNGKFNKVKMVPRRSFGKQFERERSNWHQPRLASSYQKFQINTLPLSMNEPVRIDKLHERVYVIENEMKSQAGRKLEASVKNKEAIEEEKSGFQKQRVDSPGELLGRNEKSDSMRNSVINDQVNVQQKNYVRTFDRNPYFPSRIDTKYVDKVLEDNSEVRFQNANTNVAS
ncbi:unnamed protein product [Angiostrongylus costaricensis]|uniref:Collagen triple helix repeat protein n=1 Tax=Angiostrongylus costaricensis TaxID=334426 RepID=A0A0R3PM56_ANGCS|nr:unnamed protein product [Angiostrongylus costaricensis]